MQYGNSTLFLTMGFALEFCVFVILK